MKDETDSEVRASESSAAASEAARFEATSSALRLEALSASAQARAGRAYARIRGDEGLTGSLTDDAASRLLDWARQEVLRLAAATEAMDAGEADTWLAPRLSALRHRLREIARRSATAPSPEAAVRAELLETERISDDEAALGLLARSPDEDGTTR